MLTCFFLKHGVVLVILYWHARPVKSGGFVVGKFYLTFPCWQQLTHLDVWKFWPEYVKKIDNIIILTEIWGFHALCQSATILCHKTDPSYYYCCFLHGFLTGTTQVSWYQKNKPFWILLKQRWWGWQWHQLDHMQVICTSLQTDNQHLITQMQMAWQKY